MTRTTAEEFLERHSQARLSLGDHMGANGKHEILGSRQSRFWTSGWYAQSQIYKESYLIVWPNLIVNKERAAQIRKFTLAQFDTWSDLSGLLVHYHDTHWEFKSRIMQEAFQLPHQYPRPSWGDGQNCAEGRD